jgi:hypothetical protein
MSKYFYLIHGLCGGAIRTPLQHNTIKSLSVMPREARKATAGHPPPPQPSPPITTLEFRFLEQKSASSHPFFYISPSPYRDQLSELPLSQLVIPSTGTSLTWYYSDLATLPTWPTHQRGHLTNVTTLITWPLFLTWPPLFLAVSLTLSLPTGRL